MEIKKSKYEGYIWYSDANEPKILDSEDFKLKREESENPFILEAQLFDGKTSHSIKFVDGKYIHKQYNLDSLSAKVKTEKVFKMNRGGDRELIFNQYWDEVKDEENYDMPVLISAELVFVGFKNKEE